MTAANDFAVRRALEGAGVEFIDENGGGPGLRLRKRRGPRSPNKLVELGEATTFDGLRKELSILVQSNKNFPCGRRSRAVCCIPEKYS